jgi:GNAT superfamily N-acetyltransferase
MFRQCSPATVYGRFFGRPAALPRRYVAGALAGRPDRHDALVVRYGDGLHVAGLASLVALTEGFGGGAELGVLVADGWQRRGLGTAMVALLLARAGDRGVERVEASVLVGREGPLGALARRLHLERLTRSAETVTGVFRLTASIVDAAPAGLQRRWK